MGSEDLLDASKQTFEFQRAMLEKGFEQVQKQILHLTEILFKIKASSITVWVALMGWALSGTRAELVPLGGVVILGFWFLEALYKGVQIRYIEVSVRLMRFANDRERLNNQFGKNEFEPGIVYPLAIERTELERLSLLLRGLISPTVATLYLFLGFANILVWFAVSGK